VEASCRVFSPEVDLDRKQRAYIFLTALFVAALIAGDFVGGKFFMFAGHSLSAGIIPFPLTFVLTDVVNEFYGKEGARRLTYAGLLAAVFVWTIINVALALPTMADSPISDVVFRSAFGTSARLYLASLTAYLIGQVLDISIFQMLRRLTGHRLLWLRSTGSTVLSQAVDSLSVSFVFLIGTRPLDFIMANAANNYVGKLIMAILLTPLIYLGHAIFSRHLGVAEMESPAGATAQPDIVSSVSSVSSASGG
jgi:queuosine precursor transporter